MKHVLHKLHKLQKRIAPTYGKKSYAQCGEDIIADFIFESLQIPLPAYLDVGANHPCHLNNTFHFYNKGSRGVLVEPDPYLCAQIRRQRRGDTCLNVGIGMAAEAAADFYVMSTKTLNTFSRDDAEEYQRAGNHRIESVLKIPLHTLNDIVARHFTSPPDFLSIDIEGWDSEVLTGFDWNRYPVKVLCVETLTYDEDRKEEKLCGIIDQIAAQNYMVYADTYINTIFVHEPTWRGR